MAKMTKEKPDRRRAPTKKTTIAAPRTVTDEEIARRAFEVYCSRGDRHGGALEDWLQAERELRSPGEQIAG